MVAKVQRRDLVGSAARRIASAYFVTNHHHHHHQGHKGYSCTAHRDGSFVAQQYLQIWLKQPTFPDRRGTACQVTRNSRSFAGNILVDLL